MTLEQKQQIQAYYQEGKNVNQIALISCCGIMYIAAILEEDIKVETPKKTKKVTVLDGAGVSEALFQDEPGL